MTHWRIRPDQATDYAVEQLARRESRSTSAMLQLLIREALAARRKTNTEVDALVAVLRQKSPA